MNIFDFTQERSSNSEQAMNPVCLEKCVPTCFHPDEMGPTGHLGCCSKWCWTAGHRSFANLACRFCCPKVSRSDERIWWNTNFHVFSSISRVVWWMYAEDHNVTMWNQKTVERADGNYVINTVDRGNPPPVDVLDCPVFTGFHTSQVVRRISSINGMTHVGKQLAWPPDSPPILVPHSQAKISLALGC